jgi:N-acetylglutamate synthase-like GNAT family acetyltransferase
LKRRERMSGGGGSGDGDGAMRLGKRLLADAKEEGLSEVYISTTTPIMEFLY